MPLAALIHWPPRIRVWLGALLLVGFALRVVVGIAELEGWRSPGSRSWWERGYTGYAVIAEGIAQGRGVALGPHRAPRPPVYPSLLASIQRVGGRGDLLPLVVHAALGTGTVLLAYLLGRAAFGAKAGLVAAGITAGYPYYVAHDTALQDTALFTLLTAFTVLLAWRARGSASLARHAGAGLSAGVAVLCRESLLPFLPLAAIWLSTPRRPASSGRARLLGAVFLLSALLAVAPWLARNARIFGVPVFTAGFGYGLGFRIWLGNNEATLSHYPWGSIDRSGDEAVARLAPADRALIARLGDIEVDRWLLRRALVFAVEEPARIAGYAGVKVFAAFGPLKSPLATNWQENVAYSVSYVALAVLATLGMWAERRHEFVSLVSLLIVAFLVVAVASHAHTSHRSYLDVQLAVLAARTLTGRSIAPEDRRLRRSGT